MKLTLEMPLVSAVEVIVRKRMPEGAETETVIEGEVAEEVEMEIVTEEGMAEEGETVGSIICSMKEPKVSRVN